MRLLLVEDDTDLAQSLRPVLERAGFAVDASADGVDAEFRGDSEPYDAVVLDLGLPKRSGLDVLRNWRARENDVPVIILTARDAWHERVDGLRAGADDYLGKPFYPEELIARVRAVVRRRHGKARANLELHGLILDEERQCLHTADGNDIALTGTEFRLLQYLMLNPGRILSKTQLTEHVYADDADRDSNVIEVYINRLRRKLGDELIETRRGQGYLFKATS